MPDTCTSGRPNRYRGLLSYEVRLSFISTGRRALYLATSFCIFFDMGAVERGSLTPVTSKFCNLISNLDCIKTTMQWLSRLNNSASLLIFGYFIAFISCPAAVGIDERDYGHMGLTLHLNSLLRTYYVKCSVKCGFATEVFSHLLGTASSESSRMYVEELGIHVLESGTKLVQILFVSKENLRT
jgi:hypothetical protein